MDNEEVLHAVGSRLAKLGAVRRVVAFGSRARNSPPADSDLYLMIVPPQAPERPPFGMWEIGPLVAAAALAALAFFHYLRQAAAVPFRDPFLAESSADAQHFKA